MAPSGKAQRDCAAGLGGLRFPAPTLAQVGGACRPDNPRASVLTTQFDFCRQQTPLRSCFVQHGEKGKRGIRVKARALNLLHLC